MSLQIFRQTHLPYLLKEISDSEFVVLNREYCYLGTNIGHSLDMPIGTIRLKITKRKLDSLGLITVEAEPRFYALYSDGTNPSRGNVEFKEYCAKLEKLLSVDNYDSDCSPVHVRPKLPNADQTE